MITSDSMLADCLMQGGPRSSRLGQLDVPIDLSGTCPAQKARDTLHTMRIFSWMCVVIEEM